MQTGLHQHQITSLQQGPVNDQADAGAVIGLPVVGEGIGGQPQRRRLRYFTAEQRGATDQQGLQVGGAAFPQGGGQGQGEGRRHGAEGGQVGVLLRRSGQHQKLPGSFAASGGPVGPKAQLFEAVAPVPPPAQQPHNHHLGCPQ